MICYPILINSLTKPRHIFSIWEFIGIVRTKFAFNPLKLDERFVDLWRFRDTLLKFKCCLLDSIVLLWVTIARLLTDSVSSLLGVDCLETLLIWHIWTSFWDKELSSSCMALSVVFQLVSISHPWMFEYFSPFHPWRAEYFSLFHFFHLDEIIDSYPG